MHRRLRTLSTPACRYGVQVPVAVNGRRPLVSPLVNKRREPAAPSTPQHGDLAVLCQPETPAAFQVHVPVGRVFERDLRVRHLLIVVVVFFIIIVTVFIIVVLFFVFILVITFIIMFFIVIVIAFITVPAVGRGPSVSAHLFFSIKAAAIEPAHLAADTLIAVIVIVVMS